MVSTISATGHSSHPGCDQLFQSRIEGPAKRTNDIDESTTISVSPTTALYFFFFSHNKEREHPYEMVAWCMVSPDESQSFISSLEIPSFGVIRFPTPARFPSFLSPTICEQIPPEDLVETCTEYFEAMCGQVIQSQGTVGKATPQKSSKKSHQIEAVASNYWFPCEPKPPIRNNGGFNLDC